MILSKMPDIKIIIATSFLAIISLKLGMYWLWLWQLKEYRRDRISAHFKDIGTKNFLLTISNYYALRQRRSPKFTWKSFLAVIFSLALNFLIIFFIFQYLTAPALFLQSKFYFGLKEEQILFAAILLELLLVFPFVILIIVSIFNFFSNIFKKITIAKAAAKMSKFPNMKVIGITGSYGKSTVKEILYEIASRKYKVFKTPANINTPIGIAKLILDHLDPSYEVFLVEMGAYKIGEIKEICDILHPKIGIITAINEQHMALFGNINNTIKAKFELFDNLPKNGTAILNIGDKNIQIGVSKRQESGVSVKLYSVGAQSDYYASDVSMERQTVKFKLISGQKMQDFKINMSGRHNISNAMAAIIAAENIGINLNECSQIIQRIVQFPEALKISIGPNTSTLIDDTYNSNPDGVMAAFDYLKNQKGRKIIILSSLIELGGAARKIHEKIGEEAASFAREIIVLDDYYFADILKGANKIKNNGAEIRYEKNRQKIAKRLEKELKFGDTVLFINRSAGKVLELLTHSTKAQG